MNGACRTIDPARQAGRQQAPCRGARSDERDHVYFEHGMPVACDPERSAAAQHTFRLSKQLQTSCAPYVSRATWTWIWPSKRRCGELAGACAVQNVRENAETRD